MDKLIKEELDRIILLSKYNMKLTLNENKTLINEQGLKGFLRAIEHERGIIDDITRSMKEAEFLSHFGGKGIKDTLGRTLRTADDVIKAAREGNLSSKTLSRFNFATFKTTKNKAIEEALAEEIAPSLIKKYGNLTPSEAKLKLSAQGLSPEKAEALIKVMKAGETGRSGSKTITQIGKESDDAFRATEQQAKAEMENATRQAKIKNFDDQIDAARAEKAIREKKIELAKIKDSTPNKVLLFLKTNRAIRFVRKLGKWVISGKMLLLLAGGIAGYLVWKNWAKINDLFIEDDIDDSRIEHGGGDEAPSPQQTLQTEDGPGDGIVYGNCPGDLKLGCRDEYTNDIKKIQGCLGVPKTGFFGKNTEARLISKWGKNTINDEGIDTLCGNF